MLNRSLESPREQRRKVSQTAAYRHRMKTGQLEMVAASFLRYCTKVAGTPPFQLIFREGTELLVCNQQAIFNYDRVKNDSESHNRKEVSHEFFANRTAQNHSE